MLSKTGKKSKCHSYWESEIYLCVFILYSWPMLYPGWKIGPAVFDKQTNKPTTQTQKWPLSWRNNKQSKQIWKVLYTFFLHQLQLKIKALRPALDFLVFFNVWNRLTRNTVLTTAGLLFVQQLQFEAPSNDPDTCSETSDRMTNSFQISPIPYEFLLWVLYVYRYWTRSNCILVSFLFSLRLHAFKDLEWNAVS